MDFLRAYDKFILANAGQVSSIESTLRSLTYVLPGRFKDAELAGETLHSILQLVGIYHDSLLAKAVAGLPSSVQKPTPTPHSRYTKFWLTSNSKYKHIALMIVVVQYTELLLEMMAKKKWGEKGRWRMIIGIEGFKAACRLCLLQLTKSRPLVEPPMPGREIDPETLEDLKTKARHPMSDHASASEQSEVFDDGHWKMPRTGKILPTMTSNHADSVTDFLLRKVLTVDDVKPPLQLLHKLRGLGKVAEVLYILRPVIYAVLMRHWSKNKNSRWKPWLVGLAMEYLARQMSKKDFEMHVPGGMKASTRLEREEMKRRMCAMGWWALRGAFYEDITKPFMDGAAAWLEKKPLIGLAGSLIGDYQYLWEKYYFSTATL